MSYLEVKDLAFSYGDREVFRNLSFSVEPGEIFCLVGPNGCGKTTLQHCILGHLHCKSGDILINGRSIKDFSAAGLASEIAFVPQDHSRSFPYRVLDVVAMGQIRNRHFAVSGKDDEKKAMEVLKKLGIDFLAETEYTALSGGELQMVLLARALCQDSNILILDEPAAHLDTKRAQSILMLLNRIARDDGKMILMSTHDFNHPLLFEDEGANVKMAFMEKGVLSRSGTPMEILSSGCLQDVYGIESQILEVNGVMKRHYLAAWSRERGAEKL